MLASKALELLKELVKIPSPSGYEEELSEYIVSYLKNLNYSPKVDSVGNVVLDFGADIWVTAHMDTVEKQVNFSFDGEFCYGTGVADDKASIAAILLALESGRKNFNCALFVDEEESGFGSKKFVEGKPPSMAVVMEPTELKICSKHWGVVEFSIEIEGKQAHGSTPWAGENAIEKALDLIEELRKIGEKNGAFLNLLQAKSAPENIYAIPNSCYLKAEYLLPEKPLPLLELLETLEKYGKARILEVSNPFVSHKVAKILENAVITAGIKLERACMPSWTDAVNLNNAGWDVAVFGPGKLEICHTRMEKVSIYEIIKASEVLRRLEIKNYEILK
ncbi:MAG: hypothetical protein DSY33_02760 [Archaeoglobus sp.]|nr:MAG: hypothetical protein DSY33_02760 [Archaeoglobus sp.]